MATEVLLPKLGFSMNEGVLAEWLVADGGKAVEGQPLYALEAEKSTQEIESPASGQLRIIAQAGETYEVGTLLAVIDA
jgi:pyruvate/2-oxoglutarate dehydrogenase complex dihydrolipoamide acyltransferase (E2) component